ncbi:MAG TPA: hypothetical protein VFV10_20335 [Gammaproteobacteria bacterium]|nr:hypothetical protein [Gammaproteobacteria bacterium]
MSTTHDSQRSSEASQEIARTREEAERLARSAADTAQRRGREEIDKVKQKAADKAEQIADAIDSSADDLEGNGGDALSGYGHSMATLMRRLAGGLRERDIEEFASDLASYARRSPGVFLAGSVALGFGLSRLLKASSSRTDELDQRYELDYDDDYDVERYDEDYDFDSTLERSTQSGAAGPGAQPSPSPEVPHRTPDEPWPRAPGGAGTSGSSSSDGGTNLGGHDRG